MSQRRFVNVFFCDSEREAECECGVEGGGEKGVMVTVVL